MEWPIFQPAGQRTAFDEEIAVHLRNSHYAGEGVHERGVLHRIDIRVRNLDFCGGEQILFEHARAFGDIARIEGAHRLGEGREAVGVARDEVLIDRSGRIPFAAPSE